MNREKKIQLNIKNLPETQQRNMIALQRELDFELSDNGVPLESECADVFRIARTRQGLKIYYTKNSEFYLALKYIVSGELKDGWQKNAKIKNLSLMVDCSRNAVLSVKSVKQLIRLLAISGYNSLMLYTEDTYEVDGEPYFGYLRGRYTKDELKEIDAYGASFGITLIPCIQTLAHLGALNYWWNEYYNIMDCDDILLVGEDRTYQLIDHMFASVAECFSSKLVHIGMDEAWRLGSGKYLQKHGYEDKITILKKHLEKVVEISKKYGFELAMWSDMFFRPLSKSNNYYNLEPVPQRVYRSVPKNVQLIYWDYCSEDQSHYETHLQRHLGFKRRIWMAGSGFTSFRFVADNEKGIRTMSKSFQACVKKNVENYLVTLWGDDGNEASCFSALPSVMYLGSMNYGDTEKEFRQGFMQICGISFKQFNALCVPRDRYMFYNDCFSGVYDTAVKPGTGDEYKKYKRRLSAGATKSKYAYLFQTRKAYFDFMEIKFELGKKTREIYQSKDRVRLCEVIGLYDKAIRKVEIFYEVFRREWMTEKKPSGFEIQDVRIGGLIQRMKHCKKRLIEYTEGKAESIPELEEDLLDWNCQRDERKCSPPQGNVSYRRAISVNDL